MAFNLALKSKSAEASFSINRDALTTFLNAANRIVPRKTTVPILRCIHFYFKDSDGFIEATDTDLFVRLSLKGVHGNGVIDIAVDSTALASLLEKSPRSCGTLLVEREGTSLSFKDGIVTCGKLAGVNGSDCPSNRCDVGKDVPVVLTGYDLKFIDKYIAPLCITDTQYTALDSVLFEMSGDNHGFAATDRHALVFTDYIDNADVRRAIQPKAIKAMSALENGGTLFLGATAFEFNTGIYSVSGRCTGGAYPDFHKLVVRDGFDHEKTVDVKVLREDLNRLIIELGKTPKGHCPVFITYSGDTVRAVRVPSDYNEHPYGTLGGIKMDALKLSVLMERFDDNSQVMFKSVDNLSFPTQWIDSRATTLFMPMS